MVPTSQDDGSSTVTSSPLQTFSMMISPSIPTTPPHPYLDELKSEERGLYLIHLLLTCAKHVASGNLEQANTTLDQISHLATPHGDTMQRIASYFAKALAHRVIMSWPGLYKALNLTQMPTLSDELEARDLYFEVCPFLKLALTIANQAIADAMEGENIVHVIDLSSSDPAQWIALLKALSMRREGPPHVKITAIHTREDVLEQIGSSLTAEAEKLDIPFRFNPVASKLENLDLERLRVKTGEALAISSILKLHTLLAPHDGYGPIRDLASSTATSSVDGFLSAMRELSPKIMVVAEQDFGHNGPNFMERLLEALHSYAALFDCLEVNACRSSGERLKIERAIYGEEIENIVSCEGSERVVRHERLERWVKRFEVVGFLNVPMSYVGIVQARRVLHGYGCEGYKMREENGCVVICWQDRALFSLSGWRCRKYK